MRLRLLNIFYGLNVRIRRIKKFKVVLALVVASLIVLIPVAIYTGSLLTYQTFSLDGLRRDDFLQDFDFMVERLEEDFPFFDLMERSWGVNFMELATETRSTIENAPRRMTALDFYDILANDLFYHLNPHGTDGHWAGVGHLRLYNLWHTMNDLIWYLMMDRDGNDINPNIRHYMAWHYARSQDFARPEAVYFFSALYYRENGEHFRVWTPHYAIAPNKADDHIVLESLKANEIAYIGFRHNMSLMRYISTPWYNEAVKQIREFYEEVNDYSHLIIDLRGNGGGHTHFFEQYILAPLFNASNSSVATLSPILSHEDVARYLESGGVLHNYIYVPVYVFYSTTQNNVRHLSRIFRDYTPMQELIKPPNMNANDFEQFNAGKKTRMLVRSFAEPRLENAKIWVLVDEMTASAAEQVLIPMKYAGIATLVGANTLGIPSVQPGSFRGGLSLPNTGIYISYDFGYLTDPFGNTWEGYGITPHYFNRPGMDALETVLAMITEMDE